MRTNGDIERKTWLYRQQAALKLGISDRAVHDRAAKGKLRRRRAGKRWKYYVPDPKPKQLVPLPLNRFNHHNTFVAWVTFAPTACARWEDIARWCKEMSVLIEAYVEEVNGPVEENKRARSLPQRMTLTFFKPYEPVATKRTIQGAQRQFRED